MIDIVVQYQALIRELVNGSAMILFLTLSIMVGVFMWDTMLAEMGKSSRGWTHAPGIATACALWWIFLAETYRTGAVWVLYQFGKQADERATTFFAPAGYFSSYGYLLAGLVLNAGLLRAIYIFTPPEWKNRVWVYASAGAALFVSAPSIFSIIKDNFNAI